MQSRHIETIEQHRSAFFEQRASSFGFNITTPRYQVGSPQWQAANHEAFARAFKSQVAVYACVLKRANAVSQAPLRVYKDTDGDPEEVADHPLRKLLSAPNPTVSEAEFYVHTITQMDAVGFAAIEIERSINGTIIGLWHLRAEWLRMIPQAQQAPIWEYRVPGNDPKIIPAENIIIVPGGPTTDLKPTGMSPIEVALREVGINDSATDFLKLFLDTGGVPRYALISPNEIKDQAKADAIRERWSQVYGGYRNWSQIALLHGGMEIKEVGANLDGLAYPSLRALLETHICAVFGVPPILVGIQAGLDASTYSNYEQARKGFFEDTVSALWSRIAGAIGRVLLPAFGSADGLYCDFDKSNVVALQEDQGARWERAARALQVGGITLNQYQSYIGMPGIGKDGDVFLWSVGVEPIRPKDIGKLADQAAEPPVLPPALGGPGNAAPKDDDDGDAKKPVVPPKKDDDDEDPPAKKRALFDGETEIREALIGQNFRERSAAVEDLAMRYGLDHLPIETRERIVSGNRRRMTRLASEQWASLATLFRNQADRVADAYLKRSRRASEDADFELRNMDDLEALLGQLDAEVQANLVAFYQRVGRSAFSTASRVVGVGIDFDLSNPHIRRTQRDLARRVVGINAETRSNIADIVTKGLAAGKKNTEIADDLRGLYRETYRNRSLTIARTESQVAYNLATADAYKASGAVLAMILHDNPQHNEDPGSDGLTCAQRDGIITDVDAVARHIYGEHPNGQLAASPLLVRPLGAP